MMVLLLLLLLILPLLPLVLLLVGFSCTVLDHSINYMYACMRVYRVAERYLCTHAYIYMCVCMQSCIQ